MKLKPTVFSSVLLVTALWAIPSTHAQQPPGAKSPNVSMGGSGGGPTANVQIGTELDEILSELADIRSLTTKRIRIQTRQNMGSRLARIENELRSLKARVSNPSQGRITLNTSAPAPNRVEVVQQNPCPSVPQPVALPTVSASKVIVPYNAQPMAIQEFARLVRMVQDSALSSDRLSVVTIAAGEHYFDVKQIATVLKHISYVSEKLRVAELMIPRLMEPSEGYKLLKSMQFDSDKRRLKVALDQHVL